MSEIEIWDPFREMRRFRRSLFSDFSPARFSGGIREPLIDVIDKGKELEVLAELPGVEKNDIDLEVEESQICLSAKTENKIEEKDEEGGHYYSERSSSSFYRSIPLSFEIIPDKAEAEFKNGILKITLPKKHPDEMKEKKRKLEIK